MYKIIKRKYAICLSKAYERHPAMAVKDGCN